MASDNNAVWTNGKKFITGSWNYIWHRDCFSISIDKHFPGLKLRNLDFMVSGDSPDFGTWKRLNSPSCEVFHYKVCTRKLPKYLIKNKYNHLYWCCEKCISEDDKIINTFKKLKENFKNVSLC